MAHLDKLKAQEVEAKKRLAATRTSLKTLRTKRKQEEDRLAQRRCLEIGRLATEMLGDVDLETVRRIFTEWQNQQAENAHRHH